MSSKRMAKGRQPEAGNASRLSPKQQAFIIEYLIDFNATRAAQRAGYKGNDHTLASVGWENLRKPEIFEVIDRHLSENALRATEVLQRLGTQARADLGEFMTADGDIDLAAMKDQKATGLIKRFKRTVRSGVSPQGGEWSEERIEVELHDAQAALVHLGRHYGLFDQGATGAEDAPIYVKLIEGPRDVR